MKAKVSLKMFVLSAALLVVSLATSARSYDNQLIYNPIEENGMTGDKPFTKWTEIHLPTT